MSNTGTNILRQKVIATAKRQAKSALQSSMVQNIEKAIAQVFLDCLKLEVSAIVSERTINTHITTIDTMTSVLFGIVDFGDNVGLIGVDAPFIDTAIVNLTGGHSEKDTSRKATITDGAICRFALNKILAQVFVDHEQQKTAICMQDYEVEKAPLVFLLSEKPYALLRIQICDSEGAELGEIELVIPQIFIEETALIENHNTAEVARHNWRDLMLKTVIDAPIELNVIVQRMDVSLARILELKKGELLELTHGSLTALTLEGHTSAGPKTVFEGHLGALKTQKAFKITHIPDDEHTST